MERHLINFSTAKLAKLAGFNDDESGFYYPLRETTKGIYGKVKIGELRYSITDCAGSEFFKDDNFALAPIQSVLQQWLREIHRIHIRIEHDNNGSHTFWEIMVLPIYNYSGSTIKLQGFDTYEDALEAGLQEALKLIQL
jgi:hypothetical protein